MTESFIVNKVYHKNLTFRKAHPRSEKIASSYDPKPFVPTRPLRVSNKATGTYSMQIYPNGEFGIGYLQRSKKTAEDRRQDKKIVQGYQVVDFPQEHELTTGEKYYDDGDMKQGLVKLDSAPKSTQPKKRYGTKGISSYGKKMVRNGAFLLHKEAKKSIGKYLQFSTLTIPPLTEGQEQHICGNWSYLVRRFFEECRREYARHGKDFKYVCVTEIQPQRWEKRREVGLHLHYIYNAEFIKSTGGYCITDDFVRQLWWRLLSTLNTTYASGAGESPCTIPLPMYRREKVKKSAEGYIGKYMSKGGKLVHEVREEKGESVLPRQWWSMSLELKEETKRQTIRTFGQVPIGYILDAIFRESKDVLYFHEATIQINSFRKEIGNFTADFTVGYGGRMSQKLRNEVMALLSF